MHRLEPTRQASAISDAALADCASEPIRTPGAIQPHGVLIAFDSRTREVQHASANVSELIGKSLDDVLGRAPAAWLSPGDAFQLERALELDDPLDSDAPIRLAINGASLDGRLSRLGDLSMLELELSVGSLATSEPLLARALRRLQGAVGLQTLHEVTVREVRLLTGCDRVVIYAFGAQGHGQVLAEARADDMAPFLGLNFPASDIPAQARELYRLNWLRMIPDVDYEPVRIATLLSANPAVPLDLTFSSLRSVSPIHREYMRHMGAGSSMSISLLRDGELWGLISCVHRTPRLIPAEIRTACLSIGRLLSLQISALESKRESELAAANERLLAPLVKEMQRSPGAVFESLSGSSQHLLQLTGASGVAVVIGPVVSLFGICPSESQVADLSVWTAEKASASGHFATSILPLQHPPAQEFASIASGLLAITLPKPELSMVLWFRPELIETVTWAGNPYKAPEPAPEPDMHRLSPRHSFDAWTTLSRHHAAAWGQHRVQAARDLRRAVIELDLADQVVRERHAVASRDELVAVVSHDLRSPLSVVALQASMLTRTLVTETSEPSRRIVAAAQSIQRATSRMSEMLRDLLDLTAIEQGRYRVHLQLHRVDEIFEDSSVLLGPLAESQGVALTFRGDADLVVSADAERLYQVISNLVGNALKFTASGGSVVVSAHVASAGAVDFVRFAVADTGSGISPEQLPRIFERYWHVRAANPTGTGLGLYIASGIVAAHGGRIWAESVVGVGSTFHFTLRRSQVPTVEG